MYLGVLQYFQYRYQLQRLYVLIALEKANPMDTVVGEGAWTDKVGWEMFLLLPFSLIAQFWQLYNAYSLLKAFFMDQESEWQVALMGYLFLCLGVGNLLTTLKIYCVKFLKKA